MTRITRWRFDGTIVKEPESESEFEFEGTGEAYARTSDPKTSHIAARTFNPNPTERAIIAALQTAPNGMNCYEVVVATGLRVQTVSARFAPLHRADILEYHYIDDTIITRPGECKVSQQVHFLKQKAKHP